jgi:putative SOS response-associated peptidase YedK
MAPTKQAPVVLTRVPRQGTEETYAEPPAPVRQLRLLTWGLVPSWAKDVKVGQRMANARAESVLEKPSYARAAKARRCLVPAKGYYEWQVSPTATDAKGKPRKQPFFIHRADGQPLAIAGLYEFWRDKSVEDGDAPDAWLTTFTVITTDADPGLDRIHDRQPLILEREDWDRWLDPTLTDEDTVRELLAFHQAGRLDAYPISTAVNATRNNGPDLLRPVGREQLVGVVDPVTGEVVGG